ncbi:increased DNA methylation 1-like [Rutidosis leptorrhynchoides]|uniref:increased DNA methylation 1-like n=1 Tax=Rutidosis leptorrhynchoides TaxID=125765 RepID=UPI003A99B717
MKGHSIRSMKMLSSSGMENSHDAGVGGSVDEYCIFREVFFGHESTRNSKICDATGSINFDYDEKNLVDIPVWLDNNVSVMNVHEEFQNRNDDYDCGGISEEFDLLTRNSPDVEVKQMEVSPEEGLETKLHIENVVKPSVPAQSFNKKWNKSAFIELDNIEFLIPHKDTTMKFKHLLRYHAYCLLRAAGWAIGKRNRLAQNKGVGEFVFRTPEGRPIREFHRAWKICGQRLVKDAKFLGARGSKLWTDLTQFQSDISNAFIEVEQLRVLGSPIALARWWYVLDPFAKVVFIDRSVRYLKEGKEVKAVRTVVNSGNSKSSIRCKKLKKYQKGKKGNSKRKVDDLLLSDMVSNKSTKKRNFRALKGMRKYKKRKGNCRLLPRSSGKWSGVGVRTVLCWLIDLGVIHVNEAIHYRDPQDYLVVKDGVVTRNGILCKCCKKVFSVSEFKNHAGYNMKRPCLDLVMQCGKSFTLCQLEAWSTEYNVRKSATRVVQIEGIDEYDDTCGLCGDGGDLICCDNCTSTFHQACLSIQELPEGNWYCSTCCCWSCGNIVNPIDASVSNAMKCLQCKHIYHEVCVRENGIGELVGHTWFCGETCERIHSGLQFLIGCMNPISEGFSWTLLRCNHDDQRVYSGRDLNALKVECNLKLAVALTIMEECFLPMVDTRTGIRMIPHVLYNWGSEFVRLNYEGFYTVILEKDDIILCVASLRIHGGRVAELPLIATCSRYRRQGMCRLLMNAIEEMLKFYKVETLVVSAIPDVVETWITGFGFSLLEAKEKKTLDKTNFMVFPGSVWLKKPMYQGSNQIIGEPHLS